MVSASSVKPTIGATGPNVSSSRMRIPFLTPTNTVGSKNNPSFLLAADERLRALAEGIVNVRGDLLETLLVDERPDLCLIAHRIADAKLAHTASAIDRRTALNPARARRCGWRTRRSGRRCETSSP